MQRRSSWNIGIRIGVHSNRVFFSWAEKAVLICIMRPSGVEVHTVGFSCFLARIFVGGKARRGLNPTTPVPSFMQPVHQRTTAYVIPQAA